MNQFGAYEPEDELNEIVKFIKGVLESKQIIVSMNELYPSPLLPF